MVVFNATIYEDAIDADWKNNPEAYTIQHMVVDASTVLNIKLAAGGGAAISTNQLILCL